jgi:hypothetical protein
VLLLDATSTGATNGAPAPARLLDAKPGAGRIIGALRAFELVAAQRFELAQHGQVVADRPRQAGAVDDLVGDELCVRIVEAAVVGIWRSPRARRGGRHFQGSPLAGDRALDQKAWRRVVSHSPICEGLAPHRGWIGGVDLREPGP